MGGNRLKVLISPAGYTISKDLGSEPTIYYNILRYLNSFSDLDIFCVAGEVHSKDFKYIQIFNTYLLRMFFKESYINGQLRWNLLKKNKFILLATYFYIKEQLFKLIKGANFDIIHHLSPCTITSFDISPVILRKPFVFGPILNPWAFLNDTPTILLWMNEQTIKFSDAIIFEDNFIHQYYEKKGILDDKVTLDIPTDGISPEYVKKVKNIKYSLLYEKKEKNDGTFRIITGGSLAKSKCIDLIILAIKELVKNRNIKNIELYITGPKKYEDYINYIIRKYDIQNNVVFLGWISKENLIKLRLISHVYILLEKFRSNIQVSAFNNVGIRESIFAYLPVITNRSPIWGKYDFSDFIIHTSTDIQEIADRLEYILNNNEAIKKKIDNKYIRLFNEFNTITICNKIKELYYKII